MDTLVWIDDDQEYQELCSRALRLSGFSVVCASGIREGSRLLANTIPNLILLDASLPDGQGVEFCRELRKDERFQRTLVAVLTGQRRVWNRIEWFDAGADQCWLKSSNPQRIAALVRGLLRRRDTGSAVIKPEVPGLSIDMKSRTVSYRGNRSLPLSYREALFFDLLCNAFPDVLPRNKVHERIAPFGPDEDPEIALNQFVKRLRQKLRPDFAAALKTVRGEGYRLVLPD